MAKQSSKNRQRRRPKRDRSDLYAEHAPTAPTSAEAWISHVVPDDVEVLRLPSGNAARVRYVKPEAFLEQGLIPDPLTAIVEKAIQSKKGMRPKDTQDLVKNPERLGAALEMMDRVLVYCVVEPVVLMPPGCAHVNIDAESVGEAICGELNTPRARQHFDRDRDDFHAFVPGPRDPGVLYADRVDLDDKAFVLQWAMGGTRDLERFRREHGTAMAGVASVPGESR